MRFIKLVLLALILIVLTLLGVANREAVTVKLLPGELASLAPFQTDITLPLFLVIGAAVLVGLLLGYIIEYLREARHRRTATVKTREASHWRNKAKELQKKAGEDDDDVLALLN